MRVEAVESLGDPRIADYRNLKQSSPGVKAASSATPLPAWGRRRRLPQRVALLLGAEGEGLSPEVLRQVDHELKIPMAPGVDSLNVATASGIALHCLGVGTPG